jgi:hypothetical protein
VTNITLEQLAEAKKLSPEFLREIGLQTIKLQGAQVVKIPYYSETGEEIAMRYRLALNGDMRFRWRAGSKAALYGLQRLKAARDAGYILLVEGESDCWTAWARGVPAVGVPGKTIWKPDWQEFFSGLQVYLWCEPGAFDFLERVAKTIPGLRVIYAPDNIKDISELHLTGGPFETELEKLMNNAVYAADEIQKSNDEGIVALEQAAEAVLNYPDVLSKIENAIRNLGFGGDVRPAIIAYMSFTSRLLKLRHGSMPVHLLLRGPSSAGKSFAVQVVSKLHPAEAQHAIDAGSPRVLIYDDAELSHKALIFGEADSLPAGEDNPAASAIRGLLQDNQLNYDVVVRDPETGEFTVKKIVKPGPTVLITSSTKSLGDQLMTRVFIVDVTGEPAQIKKALTIQAENEIGNETIACNNLVAYQGYLQAKAPWDVVVPFARELASEIAAEARPRILRDFQRLLSLIKAVAVLRHKQRRRDASGRLVATIEDYRYIFDLTEEMFRTSTGVSTNVRRAVEAVTGLSSYTEKINYAVLSKKMGVHRDLARRWAKIAIKQEYLVNEAAKGKTAILAVGEPLPAETGLPDPDEIGRIFDTACATMSPDKKDGVIPGVKTNDEKSQQNQGFPSLARQDVTLSPQLPEEIDTNTGDPWEVF